MPIILYIDLKINDNYMATNTKRGSQRGGAKIKKLIGGSEKARKPTIELERQRELSNCLIIMAIKN